MLDPEFYQSQTNEEEVIEAITGRDEAIVIDDEQLDSEGVSFYGFTEYEELGPLEEVENLDTRSPNVSPII